MFRCRRLISIPCFTTTIYYFIASLLPREAGSFIVNRRSTTTTTTDHRRCCTNNNVISMSNTDSEEKLSRPDLIRKLLKGIETGDPESAKVVNENVYIQHNPQTQEGGEGLAKLFARLSKTNPHVNVVRAFEDGDYVFGNTEYDFQTRRIGFEVFRFEGNYAVEHWDNIQPRMGPNGSGRSMVDGPTEAKDHDKTEPNRELVRKFTNEIMMERNHPDVAIKDYVIDDLIQHDPRVEDGLDALLQVLLRRRHQQQQPQGQEEEQEGTSSPSYSMQYDTLHRILAEGNFVLTVCKGYLDGVQTSFYDLYRIEDGKICEHWNTIEAVPPKSEWKNNNGKF